MTRNVVRPTLAVYLPSPRTPATATIRATGVIIAPGGAFRFLNIDSEGHDVARWLVARGIAAFVLKYRVVETPADDALMWRDLAAHLSDPKVLFASVDQDSLQAVADGRRAMQLVRQHASEWGVAADRIGIVGFSAGAMLASCLMVGSTAAERPDFAAFIYGAPFGAPLSLPRRLPPVFMAYAGDDRLAGNYVEAFYAALRRANQHPELHVYYNGGHGFGMSRQGTSSDYWTDDLYHWLAARDLTSRPSQ